jgi:hypothetical protein
LPTRAHLGPTYARPDPELNQIGKHKTPIIRWRGGGQFGANNASKGPGEPHDQRDNAERNAHLLQLGCQLQ